ncbi:hypothetical protein BDR03DRAFT_961285 [Suillus americanus]|nr:hypothetical protein BDR03DRAFT_961285 [Suillus americanus]
MNIGAPSAPGISSSSKLTIRIPPLKGRYIPEVCITTPVPRGLKVVRFPCTPPATHVKHRVTSWLSDPPSDTMEIDESDLSELSADEVVDELFRTATLRSHNQLEPHHRYTSSSPSSAALSPGPLPPPPSTCGVRPRSDSFGDPSYLLVQPQSPSKRPRSERDEYDHRPRLSVSSLLYHLSISSHSSGYLHVTRTPF